jgi:hypothetical protein
MWTIVWKVLALPLMCISVEADAGQTWLPTRGLPCPRWTRRWGRTRGGAAGADGVVRNERAQDAQ